MPICNRFHTIRVNSGKITFFCGGTLFDALVQRKPLHPGARNFVAINYRVLGAAISKDFVILACSVLIGLMDVTDRQTDRHPDDG